MAFADRAGCVLLGMKSISPRFFAGIVGICFVLQFCGGCIAWKPHCERMHGFAPARLEGCRLRYTDNHGENFYTFLSGERFRYATISQNRTYADSRDGTCRYLKTAPNKATIKLAGEAWMSLEFDRPGTGIGKMDGDLRNYRFTIECP